MAFFASPGSDRDTRSLARSASTSGLASRLRGKQPMASTSAAASTGERTGVVRGARPPPARSPRGPAPTEFGVYSSDISGTRNIDLDVSATGTGAGMGAGLAVTRKEKDRSRSRSRRASTSSTGGSLGAELADVRLALKAYGGAGSDDGHSLFRAGGSYNNSNSHSPSPLPSPLLPLSTSASGGLSAKEGNIGAGTSGSGRSSLRAPLDGHRQSSRSPHGSRRKVAATATTTTTTGSASSSTQPSPSASTPGPSSSITYMRSSPDFLQHRVQGDSNQGSSSSNKTRSQRPPLRARTTSALATGGTVTNVDEASIPPRPPRGPRPPTTTSPTKGNFNAPLRAMSESSTALASSTRDGLSSTPSRVPFNTVNKMTHPPKLMGMAEESQQDEIEIADAYTQYQRYQNHHSQQEEQRKPITQRSDPQLNRSPNTSTTTTTTTTSKTTASAAASYSVHSDAYETDYAHTPSRGLVPPSRTGYKSSGSASDGSYGSPLSELGVSGACAYPSYSVKRLLSKPASPSASASIAAATGFAGSAGYSGVRSEPDAEMRRWRSANANMGASASLGVAGRRSGAGLGMGMGMSMEGALSDPEAGPQLGLLNTTSAAATASAGPALGSLGRARGREWGHVLNARGHARTGSSSLDGLGEGANVPYPIGARASSSSIGHGNGTGNGNGNSATAANGSGIGGASPVDRPRIQLTTAAIRRLSALGAGVSGGSSPLDVREATAGLGSTSGGGASTAIRPRASNSLSQSQAHHHHHQIHSATALNSSGSPSPTKTLTTTATTTTTTSPVAPTSASSSVGGGNGMRLQLRADSPPPPGLTPAEIVAHAYKQQEKRRAALAREAARVGSDMDTVRASKKDKEREKKAKREREKEREREQAQAQAQVQAQETYNRSTEEEEEEAMGPYYTVLGNPEGRVVAIGSARDSAFGLFDGPGPKMGARGRAAAQAIVAELTTATVATSTTTAGAGAGQAISVGGGTVASSLSLSSEGERSRAGSGSGKSREGEGEKEKDKEKGKGNRDEHSNAHGQGSGTIRRKLTKKMSGPLRGGRREGSVTRGGGGARDGNRDKDVAVGEWGEVLVVGSGTGSGAGGGDEGDKPRAPMARPSLSLNTNASSVAAVIGSLGPQFSASTSASASAPTSNSNSAVSAEGRKSATLPRERMMHLRGSSPTKASLESYVAVGTPALGSASLSGRGLPSAVNGVAPWLAEERERERTRVTSDASARGRAEKRSCDVGSMSAATSSKAKPSAGERENKENGGKLWGLVKRISSNALKDRYRETPAPPVPILPPATCSTKKTTPAIATRFDFEKSDGEDVVDKDMEESVGAALGLGMGIGMSMGIGFGVTGTGLSATPRSASSKKSGRPSTAPTLLNDGSASTEGRFGHRQMSSPLRHLQTHSPLQQNQQQNRPGTATPSLSPTLSSDQPSWDSFNRTQSSRSSASSYAADDSVLASAGRLHPSVSPLGQYILAPEKFSMFDGPEEIGDVLKVVDGEQDRERGRTERRVMSGNMSLDYDASPRDPLFYEENAPQQALPVPPRRPANSGRYTPQHRSTDASSRSASPSIPTFSADNAINTFGPGARGRSATNATMATNDSALSDAFSGNDFGSGSNATNGNDTPSLSAHQVPPRPPRSALRAQSQAPPAATSISDSPPSINNDSGIIIAHPGRTSIGGHSQASTARPTSGISLAPSPSSPTPSPASSSTPSLLPGDAQSPVSASSDARTTSSRGSGSASASPASARGGGPRGGLFGGFKSPTESAGHMGIANKGGGHGRGDATVETGRVLTEKEKMDKWDELLDRSDRAGGTLHVGLGGLLSDSMRDSVYGSVRDSVYDDY